VSARRPAEASLSDLVHESPFAVAAPLVVLVGLGFWLTPGTAHSVSGVLLVVLGVAAGLVVGGRLGLLYTFAAFVGFELAFRDASAHAALELPMEILHELIRVLAVPLFVHLFLPSSRGAAHGVSARHLYLPLLLTIPLTVYSAVHRVASPTHEGVPGTPIALLVLGAYYVAVLAVVLVQRSHQPPAEKSESERAAELERSGRFAAAGRMHARAGRVAMGADAAERGGDFALAARLYAESGDAMKAGDTYYRIGQLDEAAEQYAKAGSHAAVARVYEQLARPQDAASAWERAGDIAAAVRALEAAGLAPGAEMLYRAGRVGDAVAGWQAEGAHARAAEVLELEVGDLPGAARCYLNAGHARHAGQLLERLGRTDEAIEAFASARDGQLQALRLCLDAGHTARAEAILATIPAATIDSLQDESEMLSLARLHQQAGRAKTAISLLQKARRLESATGATRLLLGRLLLDEGLGELAEQELRIAAELPMDVAQQMEAAYLLGCVLETEGRAAEACAVFADLAQKDIAYRDVDERYRRLRAIPAG
jgi:tetratricopeptide (TPR) repeat protein